ncbi:MAG: hypothetical protein HKP25_05935 [Marinicaulis sp.]|nr:hypothetical protein [Marinicaulis sp.]
MAIASSGIFSAGGDFLEASGARIRSTYAKKPEGGQLHWTFMWTAPIDAADPVDIVIAVNASNDDASAFGDAIHFKTFSMNSGDEFVEKPPETSVNIEPQGPTKDGEAY